MNWTRERLKENGKVAFKRNYWSCVAVSVIMAVLAGITGIGSSRSGSEARYQGYSGSYSSGHTLFSIPGITMGLAVLSVVLLSTIVIWALDIFVGNLIEVGGKKFFILNKTESPSVGTVLDGFKSGQYVNIVLTMFLKNLFTTLWTLLLVVPGIVKHYEYLMIPYILAENPGMDRKEAFKISKRMMDGQKMDTFILDLSFIGWAFLSAITCGIVGIFYANPYREATFAELYAFNKAKAYEEGYIR